MSIFTTVFLTVFSGVLVALLVQLIIRFILDPIKDLHVIWVKVGFQLDYYADYWSNPGVRDAELILRTSDEFREAAMILRNHPLSIFKYAFMSKRLHMPSIEEFRDASTELVRLSNSLTNGDGRSNAKTVDRIRKHLRLPEQI